MSKVVWFADSNMHFVSAKTDLPDDYQLKSNETFVEPINQDGSGMLAPATLLGQGQGWRAATSEERAAYLKAQAAKNHSQPAGPSAEQQMIATLGQQQAKTDANVKQMQQMIAMLGSQMASSDAKEKANGGN